MVDRGKPARGHGVKKTVVGSTDIKVDYIHIVVSTKPGASDHD